MFRTTDFCGNPFGQKEAVTKIKNAATKIELSVLYLQVILKIKKDLN
jgi:hypothetical protein